MTIGRQDAVSIRPRISEVKQMKKQRPYVIVVGVDFEPDGELAFDEAVRVAAAHGNAEVHVLHVDKTVRASEAPPKDAEATGVSATVTRSETALDRLETLAAARLEQVLDETETFNRIVTHFRIGKPAPMLVQLAVDLDADLVLVGTHNRKGLKRLVLGSVAESVVHMARCPVQVVRKKDHMDVGDVPEIEPPCDACLETRAKTGGADMWCARHALAKYRPRVRAVMRGANRTEPEPWSQATPQV